MSFSEIPLARMLARGLARGDWSREKIFCLSGSFSFSFVITPWKGCWTIVSVNSDGFFGTDRSLYFKGFIL